MSESLTPFEGENLASYEALRTAVQLADGFTLIFAVTNTEAGAQEVMRRLWRDGVRYQKAWLRDPERPLVDQVADSVRSARLPVMVLGLEGLTTVGEALGRSLRNLNWTRPQWTARLPQTIVFWVTADMEADLAREAPDLWRFRSLRVEFTFGLLPRQSRAIELRRRLANLEMAPRVRLAMLMEVYDITRHQNALEEAVRLVARNSNLSRQRSFDYLRTLILTSHEIDDASLDRIGPLPRLRHITLMYTRCSDAGTASLIKKSEPRNLTDVNFFATSVGKVTFNALASLPAVKEFRVGGTPLSLDDLEALATMSSLRFVELLDSSLDDRSLKPICTIRDLSVLAVNGTSISDAGTVELSSLRRLWMLSLENTSVSDLSLPHLAKLKNLRNLDLSNTRISDRHLEVLAGLPHLTRIDLQWTKVTRKGAAKLRDLFSAQHRKVEILA